MDLNHRPLRCQGVDPALSGSATKPLTCWLTWLGPSDSPAFTPLVLAALGRM